MLMHVTVIIETIKILKEWASNVLSIFTYLSSEYLVDLSFQKMVQM